MLESHEEDRGQQALLLTQRIRAGDAAAEGELFKQYYQGVLVLLRQRTRDPALAEDLAQDTLLTVLKRLREEGIDEPRYLARFMQQTAKYTHIGWLRKRDNQLETRASVDDDLTDEASPALAVEREELARHVREILETIDNARDREILVRYYLRDQEKAVVSKDLELSADHFDRVISRARKRLRDKLRGAPWGIIDD